MDITSPRNDQPINLVGPISTARLQSNRNDEDSELRGLSVPIPLSPESLELGSSSTNQDIMLTESDSDPFSASGGNPYPTAKESAVVRKKKTTMNHFLLDDIK